MNFLKHDVITNYFIILVLLRDKYKEMFKKMGSINELDMRKSHDFIRIYFQHSS